MRKGKIISIVAMTILIIQMMAMTNTVNIAQANGPWFTVDIVPEKVTVAKEYWFNVSVTNVHSPAETYVFVNITYPRPAWLLEKVMAPTGWTYNIDPARYYVNFTWMEGTTNKLTTGATRIFKFKMITPPKEKCPGWDAKNGTMNVAYNNYWWTVYVNTQKPPTSPGGRRGPVLDYVIVDGKPPEINDMPPFLYKGCHNYTLAEGFTAIFPNCSEFDVTYPMNFSAGSTFEFLESSKVNFLVDTNITVPVGTWLEFQLCSNASFQHCLDASFQGSSKIQLPPDGRIKLKAGTEVEFLSPDPAWFEIITSGTVKFREGSEISLKEGSQLKFTNGSQFKWITPHKGTINIIAGSAPIIIEGITYTAPQTNIKIDTGMLITVASPAGADGIIRFNQDTKILFKKDSSIKEIPEHAIFDINSVTSRMYIVSDVQIQVKYYETSIHFVSDINPVWFPGQGTPGTFQVVKFIDDSFVRLEMPLLFTIRAGSGVHFLQDTIVTFESYGYIDIKTDAWFFEGSKINVMDLAKSGWVPVLFYKCGNVTIEPCTYIYFWSCENFTFQPGNKVSFQEDRVITFPGNYSDPEGHTVTFEPGANIAIPAADPDDYYSSKLNFMEGGKIEFPDGATDLLFQNCSKVQFQPCTVVTFPYGSTVTFQPYTKVEFYPYSIIRILVPEGETRTIRGQKGSNIHFCYPCITTIGLPPNKIMAFDNGSRIDVPEETRMRFYAPFAQEWAPEGYGHAQGGPIQLGNNTVLELLQGIMMDGDGNFYTAEPPYEGPHVYAFTNGTKLYFTDQCLINFISPEDVWFDFLDYTGVSFDAEGTTWISVHDGAASSRLYFVDEFDLTFTEDTGMTVSFLYINGRYYPTKIRFLEHTAVNFPFLNTTMHFLEELGGVRFDEDVEPVVIAPGGGLWFELDSGIRFNDETHIIFPNATDVHFKRDTQVYFVTPSNVTFIDPMTVKFTGKNETRTGLMTYGPLASHQPYYVKFHKCNTVWFNTSSDVVFPAYSAVNFAKSANVTFKSSSKAIFEHDAELQVYAGGRIKFQTEAEFDLNSGFIIVNTGTCQYIPYSASLGKVRKITVPENTTVIFQTNSEIEILYTDESIHFMKDTTIHFNHWKSEETRVEFERNSEVHFESNSSVHFKQDTKVQFLKDSVVYFPVPTKVVEPAWHEVHVEEDMNIKFNDSNANTFDYLDQPIGTTLRLYSSDNTTGIFFTRTSRVRFLEPTKIHVKYTDDGTVIKFMSPINRMHPQPDGIQLNITPVLSVNSQGELWINVTTFDNVDGTQWPTVTLNDTRFTFHSRQFFGNTPNCYRWEHYFVNNTAITPDGHLSITITATDCAGNTNYETISMVIDNNPPTSAYLEVYAYVHGEYQLLPYHDGKYWMCDGEDYTDTIYVHVATSHCDWYLDYDDSSIYINGELVDLCLWRACETFAWDVSGTDTLTIEATLTDCATPHNHTAVITQLVERDTTPPEFTNLDRKDIKGGIILSNFEATDDIGLMGYDIVIDGWDIFIPADALYPSRLTEIEKGVWAFDGQVIIDLSCWTGELLYVDVYAKDWCTKETFGFEFGTVVEPGEFYIVELEEGWNLFSLPLIPPNFGEYDCTELFGTVPDIVFWYYAGDWYWYPGGGLDYAYDGEGYMIYMLQYGIIVVDGYEMPPPDWLEPPPTYPVIEGWNLIGFKSTTPMLASEYLASLLAVPEQWVMVIGFNAATQEYELVFETDTPIDELMQPGQAYWAYVLKAGDIVPP